MTGGLRRRLALATTRLLLRLLPARLEGWGWALRHEVAAIDDERAALAYALDALRGIVPQIIAYQLSGGSTDMNLHSLLSRPRTLGIACAIAACGLGFVYMAMAGAPLRYLAVNAGALAIGLLFVAIVGRRGTATRLPGSVTLALACVLLATALFGDRAEGAARWLMVGPLFVQPSLVALPMMIVGFARSRTLLATAGMIIAALALALQPDRAMAGMLVAALAVLALVRPDSRLVASLAAALVGFLVTLVRPDTLPAVPYVDRILYLAFDAGPLAGLAVLGGSALLVLPALVGLRDSRDRDVHAALATIWAAVIAAAAIGNYPTPLVGYGGSAVIGYLLSLAVLPRRARAGVGADAANVDAVPSAASSDNLPTGLYSAT